MPVGVLSAARVTKLEFQTKLEETLKAFSKRQETAMQLRVEEFREEQQRGYFAEINAAKLAAKYLLQSTQYLVPNAPTSTSSQKKAVTVTSVAPSTPQEENSDMEDFGHEPAAQENDIESGSEDFDSSFNEDIFDLDEDTRQISSQSYASPPKACRFILQEEDSTVGSFASQGRYFPTKAPKFVPDVENDLSLSESEVEREDKDQYVSQFATSVPIPIANHFHSIHFDKSSNGDLVETDHEDISLIASKTFSEEREKLFGGDSLLHSSSSMAK